MDIYAIATDFRTAIDYLIDIKDRGLSSMLIYNFPKGCCDYASTLLQKYLSDEYGIETKLAKFVNCKDNKDYHYWLLVDSIMHLDITGDQYDGYSDKVYYGTGDQFHQQFRFVCFETPLPLNRKQKQDYDIIHNYIYNHFRGR